MPYTLYVFLVMNTVALNSDFPHSKKQENASETLKKETKAGTAFNREAFDKALDESLDDLTEGRVYEVDMKDPEKSLRTIREHNRQAK